MTYEARGAHPVPAKGNRPSIYHHCLQYAREPHQYDCALAINLPLAGGKYLYATGVLCSVSICHPVPAALITPEGVLGAFAILSELATNSLAEDSDRQ
jgi:hypothetical protein